MSVVVELAVALVVAGSNARKLNQQLTLTLTTQDLVMYGLITTTDENNDNHANNNKQTQHIRLHANARKSRAAELAGQWENSVCKHHIWAILHCFVSPNSSERGCEPLAVHWTHINHLASHCKHCNSVRLCAWPPLGGSRHLDGHQHATGRGSRAKVASCSTSASLDADHFRGRRNNRAVSGQQALLRKPPRGTLATTRGSRAQPACLAGRRVFMAQSRCLIGAILSAPQAIALDDGKLSNHIELLGSESELTVTISNLEL